MSLSKPRTVPAASTATDKVKANAQAQAANDIVTILRDGTIAYREAAVLLGCTAVQAEEHAKQLRTLTSAYSINRLEKSLRKQAQQVRLLEGAKRVKAGEHIDAVARELGTTTRTLYRYQAQA